MKATYSALVIGLCSLGLVACGPQAVKPQSDSRSSGRQPDWVTQPPQQAGMAYGVGSMEIYGNPADAVQRAAELAKADLIAQLKVTVSGNFSSTTTETSGNQRSSEMLRTVSNYVQSRIPTVELDEVQTSETWLDDRYAYALAELNRNEAAARLRRDIADVEQELTAIAQLQPQGTKLQQLQPLLPALTLFAKRDKLAERLALISVQRRAEPLSASLRDLHNRIYQQLDQLVVTLELQDSGARAMGGNMLEALTAQGLRLQDSGSADLRFDVSAQLSDKTQGSSHYAFADTRVTIRDGQGRVLNSFSKQAKGVSGMADVARQKAAREAAAQIAAELAVTLVDKLR